ncbi:MAG: methyltransferase domain-containing protein [Alphaproteobacteria bacterium]
MPSWNPGQYLKFADQRTQACLDLASRVLLESPRTVIDLGCGPGNSTEVLARRWPEAEIAGLDGSPDMIEAATAALPGRRFAVRDIAEWAAQPDGGGPYDLVFSNAALQWVEDHTSLFPRLFSRVTAQGALAVQMPANFNHPVRRLMGEIAQRPAWRQSFAHALPRNAHAHEPVFYYDLLAPLASRVDLWTTDYIHVLPGPEAVGEWFKGTALRPFLDLLKNEAERTRFVADYVAEIGPHFPRRTDGNVLFPFRRMFVIAYKESEAPRAC